jgi:hypothetical protein
VSRRSRQWKVLEKDVAKAFLNIGGKRVSRGSNFGLKSVDVRCSKAKALKIDAKYRVRHAHHRFMDEIVRKYCSKPTHVPVLVTKSHNQRGAFATVPLDFLAKLLDRYYLGEGG